MPQDADTDADLEKRVQCLDVKQAKAFGNNPLGNPDLWAHLLWVLITSEPLSIEVSYNDCVNLLERNVGGRLWETLEYGVAHEDFGQLRQYILPFLGAQSTPHSPLAVIAYTQEPHSGDDALMKDEIYPFIDLLAQRMAPEVILTAYESDCWSGPTDPSVSTEYSDFIRNLKIPLVNGDPSLLLHGLGTMEAIDPSLRKNMDEVFRHNGILVNTPGAGKTRLILEALCMYWGLYFVTARTLDRSSSALGSYDLNHAIEKHIPHDRTPTGRSFTPNLPSSNAQEPLEANREIARRRFNDVLLARLLLFKRFLEIVHGRLREKREGGGTAGVDAYWKNSKKAWLLAQLQPSYFQPVTVTDAFAELSIKVHGLSSDFIRTLVSQIATDVRILQIHPVQEVVEQRAIVVDEAQYAAAMWTGAFRCKNDLNPRPIFREIIFQWGESMDVQDRLSLVCAGSALNAEIAQESYASAHCKETPAMLYEVRAFHDAAYVQKYTSRYLPPDYVKSRHGERLMHRLALWLRGRPRITATFVTELMRNGYANGHDVLNAFIRKFSELEKPPIGTVVPPAYTADGDPVDLQNGFHPTDSEGYVGGKAKVVLRSQLNHWRVEELYRKHTSMLDPLLKILATMMVRSKLPDPGTIGANEAHFVQEGIAWFDCQGRAFVDEPLILLLIGRWFDRQKYRMPKDTIVYNSIYHQIAQGVRITDSKNNGFESFLALCLVEFVFAKPRPLSDIFLFGGSRIPSFASWEASLVGMYKPGPGDDIDIAVYEHQRLRRPCFSLGVDLQKHEDMIAWMRHERGYQAIMFPDNMLGPDLLCKLRLQKGGLTYYVWLAIQAKARESHVTLSDAVRSITPAYYHSKSNENEPKRQQHIQGFRDALKELPDPHPDAGEFGVLRVVASFPFSVTLTEAKVNGDKKVSGEMPDYWDTRKHGPLAIMNMDLLERLTDDVSPTQCLQRWRSKQPWQSTADSGRGKRKDREEDPAEGSRGAKQPKLAEGSRGAKQQQLAEGGKGVAADKPKKEGRGHKGKRGKGKGRG